MKTIQNVALFLFVAFSLQSCIPRYVDSRTGQPLGQGYSRGPGQPAQGGRSLKPYYPGQKPAGRVITGHEKVQTGTKETKVFRGSFTVQLWNSEDQGLKDKARDVTEKYHRENDCFPSDEYVSGQIGHKCRLTNKREG